MRPVLLLALCAACGARADRPAAPAELTGARGPDIELRRLADGVWLHDSSAVVPSYGRVHANGLVVVGARGSVVVDTAWTPAQTRWLLDRVEAATGGPVVAVIATHFHDDRAGGAGVARAAGIPVHASSETRRLLDDSADISRPFATTRSIDLGDRTVELFYPGAGHSPDNIVVYLPDQALLFGGCLIRAAASTWIGNLSDADLAAWPATVDRVIDRYPEARVVVPGHGEPGGTGLLAHTRKLAVDAAR
jgi:metallo-beta-lactamase class B